MSDTFLPRIETDIQPTFYKILGEQITNLTADPREPPVLTGWKMVAERPEQAIIFLDKERS